MKKKNQTLMRQTSTLASKLLLEKKTTADSCMNVNETTNLKEELKAHARKSYMYNSNRN